MRHIIILLASMLLLWSCTDNEQFRVNGVIEGKPSINLRVSYYADGAYHTLVTAAREGKFEFYGSSKQPTVVEITDYDYRPLVRLYASNGETFDIELDRARPLAAKISGNETTDRWSKFLREHESALTSSPAEANTAIAEYVSANPTDIVSTLLMVTAYDNRTDMEAADSVMALIDPVVRPSSLTESNTFMMQRLMNEEAHDSLSLIRYADRDDSIRSFDPSKRRLCVLALDRGGKFRDDSIVPALKRISKLKNIGVLELDLEPYANALKSGSDTLAWKMGRVPGGLAARGIERLGIPGEPYFIVADSTGAQLLRTASPGVMAAFVKHKLK